jgi:hypothetical protein
MDDLGSDISAKLQKLTRVEEENKDLIAENQQLRETLSFTQRVVEELLSQNKVYYDLLGKRRSSAICSSTTLKSKTLKEEPIVQTFNGGAWIGEIWRSDPDDSQLLGQAEAAWADGQWQGALNILTGVIQILHPSRDRARIKVQLLSAAIMQHCGVPSRALEVASQCLADASKLQYWDLMGICNFICGRAQIDLGQYADARRSLVFAEYTPGYADRVKKFLATIEGRSKTTDEEDVEEKVAVDNTESGPTIAIRHEP